MPSNFRLVQPTGLSKVKRSLSEKIYFPPVCCVLPLGPGEVGAPVFDLQGRFAGIGHAALPDLSASFLLPAEACLRIRDGLLFSGSWIMGGLE